MKIAVLGATGRTGSLIVLYAIERGFHVVALVRSEDKLKATLARPLSSEEAKLLKVIVGTPLSSSDVAMAVKGADVVYETLGPELNTPGVDIKEKAARAAVEGMKAAGATRLVSLGASSINPKFHGDFPKLIRWIVNDFMLDHIYKDLRKANDLLKQQSSWLKFTIVEPGLLVETTGPTRQYAFSTESAIEGGHHKIAYADLALAFLDVGIGGLYIGEEVHVDCTAPASAIVPVKGAFRQQIGILRDNLQRKVLPYALLGVGTVALACVVHQVWGRRGGSAGGPQH